jgi:uncharacterized protein
MLIQELTPDECFRILERTNLARLGCARNDQPYIVPIHFSFDPPRRCVYGFSAIGQKIDWMRGNPKVCLELDDIDDKNHWTTVLITGRYEEIHQDPDEANARRRAERLFRQRPEWWFPAAAKPASREPQDIVVYRIKIERITGRRASRDGGVA